ncbi:unnamed protein product [Mycena citricolor]|uniref:F-box domain-containing protein n=1 Tax=Mycena citricolor TaxID=2018698 RepID=A0AAD2HS37_9AGAR|nr:unnamed protein product [Mycena citricolor]
MTLPRSAGIDAQLVHIQNALRHYAARRCPARRLPTELWDLIFQYAVSATPEPSLMQPPLNASQVSRRWRAIALSSRRLWAGLAVTVTQRHTSDSRALEALHKIVGTWLARAGRRPLAICLAQGEDIKDTSPVSHLLDTVLRQCSAQILSLSLQAPETCLFPLASYTEYLPLLEHFSVQSSFWPHLTAPKLVLPLSVEQTPRLHALTLYSSPFDVLPSTDVTQLTSITLLPSTGAPGHLFLSADDVLDCLASAPHLHTARFALNDFMPTRLTLVRAGLLRVLRLEFRDSVPASTNGQLRGTRIGALLSLLYAPELQRFALRDRAKPGAGAWAWPQAQFLAFLSTTPFLQALHLIHLPLYETQIIECLRRLPLVRHLVLEARAGKGSQRNVGDVLLRALTVGSGATLADALHTLEFRHCGKRCTEQALISMVDSRLVLGRLGYLCVHRSAGPSPELVSKLAAWRLTAMVDVVY